jgi:hypothetical protein
VVDLELPLPDFVTRLLWDVDASRINVRRDAPLIMERVMTRGSWDAMKWLRARYSREEIASFVREEGARRLSPRDLAYWALVSGVDVAVGPGGGRPRWAG